MNKQGFRNTIFTERPASKYGGSIGFEKQGWNRFEILELSRFCRKA